MLTIGADAFCCIKVIGGNVNVMLVTSSIKAVATHDMRPVDKICLADCERVCLMVRMTCQEREVLRPVSAPLGAVMGVHGRGPTIY